MLVKRLDQQLQVRAGQQASGFVWPLDQLEPVGTKQVAKARVFPLLRVVEAVEVEMLDVDARHLVRLDHRVARAFDAPLHAKRSKQVARERGLACAQRAMQLDDVAATLAQRWSQRQSQSFSQRSTAGLIGPGVFERRECRMAC